MWLLNYESFLSVQFIFYYVIAAHVCNSNTFKHNNMSSKYNIIKNKYKYKYINNNNIIILYILYLTYRYIKYNDLN